MIEYIFKSYANIDIFFEMEQKKSKKNSVKAKKNSLLGVALSASLLIFRW